MWCPKCKAEYREGFTVCADCGCELAPASSQEALEKPPHVMDDTSADQAILRMAWHSLKRLRGRSKITVALIAVVALIFVVGFLTLFGQTSRQDDPPITAPHEEQQIKLVEAAEPPEALTPLPPVELELEPEPRTEPEKTAEIDPETLAEIVAVLSELEHPGKNLNFPALHFNPTGLEGLGLEIASFINGINEWWGPPEESFLTPENAPDAFVSWPAYFRTRSLQWHNSELESTYVPELSVLEPRLINTGDPEDFVTLHTHMEATARELFGAELDMRDIGVGRYSFEFGGYYLYTMGGAFGVPASYLTVVLSYEYIGDGLYEVSCVYIHTTDDYFSTDGDELVASLHTLPRHTVVLRRNVAGGFYYRAHILPEDDLPTPREVRELLSSIPYAGRSGGWGWRHPVGPVELSEAGQEIAEFISDMAGWWGAPSESFNFPDEAPAGFVLNTGFIHTN